MEQASELDQLIHGLDFSRCAAKYTPDFILKPSVNSKRRRNRVELVKNLPLLDGIALLLVDKAHNDVAAVSLRRTNEEVHLLYAMNRDAVETRAGVVNELIALANGIVTAEPLEIQHFRDELVSVVFRHCRHKLERRRAKLSDAWHDLNAPQPIDIAVPPADAIAEFAVGNDALAARLTPATWAEWLRGWFDDAVARPFFSSVGDTPPPTTSEVWSVLYRARLLARKPQLSVTAWPDDAKSACLNLRLSKLGQYIEAVAKISKAAQKERRRGTGSIRFRAVRLPPSPLVEIVGLNDPLAIYNGLWRPDPDQEREPLTHGTFVDTDGTFITRDLRDWKSSVTASTHCELTLALHLFRQAPKPCVIELGTSKPCCWPCTVFLERLTYRTHVRIVISGATPMTRGDWHFPEGVADKLGELIRSDLVDRAKSRLQGFICLVRCWSDAPTALCSEVDSDEEAKIFVSLIRRL